VRFERERAELVAAGRRLASGGLVPGTSGNLSIRAGSAVLISPTGARLGALAPDMVTAVDLADGRVLDGSLQPTSELPLHLAVYRATGATAIAHGHPPACTAVACVLDELPPVHYNAALLGGPVRVAGYATFGSAELATLVTAALDGRTAALLRNHGALACGDTVGQACDRLELLEWLAEVYLRAAALGEPRVLSAMELDAARAEFEARRYGEPIELKGCTETPNSST
jgi:L-fuculose-phosphate aldolase